MPWICFAAVGRARSNGVAKAGLDVAAFTRALEERTYRDTVVEYDDPAHAAGIWNVPTWEFPEEWVAEQPYSLVRDMAARFVEQETT